MNMEQMLPFSKTLLEKAINSGDIAVDATIGNGHDTLYLANLVGESGKVYGFDIQEKAVLATKMRLLQNGVADRAILLHKGHENLLHAIPVESHGKVTGAIFNLGYLPGGDKSVVTKSDTTIIAIEQLLEIMSPGGVIVLVVYPGHPGGDAERDSLLEYCSQIDQNRALVLQYQFLNQKNNPPFIVAVEKG